MESRPAALSVCARLFRLALKPARRLSVLAAIASLALLASTSVMAADKEVGPVFPVPEKGTEDDLLNFIVRVRKTPATAADKAGQELHQRQVQQAVLKASDVLLTKPLPEARLLWAMRAKGLALQSLARQGDKAAVEQLQTYVATLLKDERSSVVEEGRLLTIQQKAASILQLAAPDQEKLIHEIDAYFKSVKVDQTHYVLALTLCQNLGTAQRPCAAMAYEVLMGHFVNSTDANVARDARKMVGMGVRTRLVGRRVAIDGMTIHGQRFDIKKYRGKVVLVDFWASWCGNCVKELPNVQRVYDRYHDRGFEVVGVTLDSDSAKARKFADDRKMPWPNVISDDPNRRGWDDPNVVQLGVEALPTTIVIDQSGHVVSTEAKGEALDKLVNSLLNEKRTVAAAARPAADQ